MSELNIVVNGELKMVPAPSSLEELLARLDLDPRMVVVEHNRAIVRREGLSGVSLEEGDRVEIVHFVGGG